MQLREGGIRWEDEGERRISKEFTDLYISGRKIEGGNEGEMRGNNEHYVVHYVVHQFLMFTWTIYMFIYGPHEHHFLPKSS